MDNYIRKLNVKSLFNEKTNLNIDFDEKVNCLYGVNGSGKTTVINLLVASLFCDVSKLSNLPFSKIIISIAPTGKRKAQPFFEVSKNQSDITYTFYKDFVDDANQEEGAFAFPGILKKELDPRDEFKRIKVIEKIKKYVSTTYVPLSRMHDSDFYDANVRSDDYFLNQILRSRHIPQDELADFLDPSRRMLMKLEKNFKDKYSETQKSINKDLDSLKDTILDKMLLSKSFASRYVKQNINFKSKFSKQDYEESQKKLKAANLNISDAALSEHFEIMEENINNLNRIRDKYNSIRKNEDSDPRKTKALEDLQIEFTTEATIYRALNPSFERFFDVLKDVEKIEAKKEELLKPFTETSKLINEFLINKTFSFNSTGGFEIKCSGREIKLADLSSGEKHMIALLGRVALSPEQGAVFVADEPELSLHLEWQRKILPAIQSLSPSIQIIVATHSPAIVPANAKMIDLEECVK